MDSVKTAQSLLARQPLSEFLPYLAYEHDRKLYTLDSGIGFMFECAPQFMGEAGAQVMRGLFEQLLPSGTSLQVMMYASPNIGRYLNNYLMAREAVYGESTYSELCRRQTDFLRDGTQRSVIKGASVVVRDFRLFVSVVVPIVRSPEAFASNMEKVADIREIVMQALNTGDLDPRDLDPEGLINLMSELLNPGHPYGEVLHYDPKLTIKDQVIYTDTMIKVHEDHMDIDGKFVKSLTIRQYPQEWDVSKGVNFTGSLFENAKQIPIPFLLVLNCEYVDRSVAQSKIARKAMAAGYQAFGPFAKWFPKLSMKKQAFDDLAVALENGESPIYAYMNMFFYADDRKQAANVATTVDGLFRSLNFITQQDSYIMLPLFLQALPMCYQAATQTDLHRRKTFTTANVAELMPVQADWRGFGAPAILLISRRGQLQTFDVFSNPSGGYSGVIVAATGKGKSVFCNRMTVSYLGMGAKIWTIDVGRSYDKLCELVGGEFVVFDRSARVCINPFSTIVDINDEMAILKSIVAQMASSTRLDDLSLSYIEEAIKEEYVLKNTKMSVTDVARRLESGGDGRQRDLAKMLYPYTDRGAYAMFFEGEATISPKSQYTVLELGELKSKKDLQEVVLLALIFQIQQQMLDRTQLKMVIVDEAWDLLTGANTSEFMENGYRRVRKSRGSFFAITQGINDFHGMPAGKAMLENSDWIFLLGQRPESIEALKQTQRISLSEGYYKLLKSVHTSVGNYSEIMAYTPVGITVGRLVMDRFEQLLYTNKADEFQAIKHYRDQGLSITDAIARLMMDEESQKMSAVA
jgi:conjugal transfer ATP-binding protein TraC